MRGAALDVPPLYRPLEPEDVPEFHAARLLVLLEICGTGKTSRRIDGRTKLAKLDFFLRYPRFLERAQVELRQRGLPHTLFATRDVESEAPMIRYRYGPWDPDYRHYISFLESRGLLKVVGTTVLGVSLTPAGRKAASRFATSLAYAPLRERAEAMLGNLADWTGTRLKGFIYEVFEADVANLPLRAEIQP
jgi:hypothetical protein